MFFFVSLGRTGVWLLFNGLLATLFSLLYAMHEFDRFSPMMSQILNQSKQVSDQDS